MYMIWKSGFIVAKACGWLLNVVWLCQNEIKKKSLKKGATCRTPTEGIITFVLKTIVLGNKVNWACFWSRHVGCKMKGGWIRKPAWYWCWWCCWILIVVAVVITIIALWLMTLFLFLLIVIRVMLMDITCWLSGSTIICKDCSCSSNSKRHRLWLWSIVYRKRRRFYGRRLQQWHATEWVMMNIGVEGWLEEERKDGGEWCDDIEAIVVVYR